MDEQEIDWDARVKDIKRRIADLKERVGYYEKGDTECSEKLNQQLPESPEKSQESLSKIRASLMRSALDV